MNQPQVIHWRRDGGPRCGRQPKVRSLKLTRTLRGVTCSPCLRYLAGEIEAARDRASARAWETE